MRWFVIAGLSVAAALGVGALLELRESAPAPAASGLSLPTHFAPPRDVLGDEAVLRLAFSAGLTSVHASAFEFAHEPRRTNALQDRSALDFHAAPAPRVALPEPTSAWLAATAALIATAARRRACRRRPLRAVASRPWLPR